MRSVSKPIAGEFWGGPLDGRRVPNVREKDGTIVFPIDDGLVDPEEGWYWPRAKPDTDGCLRADWSMGRQRHPWQRSLRRPPPCRTR